MLGLKLMFILFALFCILCKTPRRANGPWLIHSRFLSAISSSYSSSSSSLLESDGSSSDFVGSNPPPPPSLPSPPPPILESDPKIKRDSFSPYWKPRGSSLSSIASARPSSVPQTTSFTNDTTTLVGVAFGFLDVYGRCCMPWISLTTFTNWRVMGWIESRLRWLYGISRSVLGGEK